MYAALSTMLRRPSGTIFPVRRYTSCTPGTSQIELPDGVGRAGQPPRSERAWWQPRTRIHHVPRARGSARGRPVSRMHRPAAELPDPTSSGSSQPCVGGTREICVCARHTKRAKSMNLEDRITSSDGYGNLRLLQIPASMPCRHVISVRRASRHRPSNFELAKKTNLQQPPRRSKVRGRDRHHVAQGGNHHRHHGAGRELSRRILAGKGLRGSRHQAPRVFLQPGPRTRPLERRRGLSS